MREIKFRAWIKSVNKMGDWNTILKECDRFSVLSNDNFIFMQFTGLLDKNGKEIYEGDVFNLLDKNGKIISPANVVQLADFLGGDYWIKQNNGVPIYEIIGSIFENKEILEK